MADRGEFDEVDHFLGLGKWAVEHPLPSVAHRDPRCLVIGDQRLDGQQYPALFEFGRKRAHLRIDTFSVFHATLGALAPWFDDQQQIRHHLLRSGGWLASLRAVAQPSLPQHCGLALIQGKNPTFASAHNVNIPQ